MSDNHDKIDGEQFKRMIDIDTEYARRNPNTFDNLPGTKPVQNFFIQKSLFQKSFQIGSKAKIHLHTLPLQVRKH